jgi:hypothetical protein
MKRILTDAALPDPVSLTLEQLSAVASDTGAMLGSGGGMMIMIYGGPIGPIGNLITPASVGQIASQMTPASVGQINGASVARSVAGM